MKFSRLPAETIAELRRWCLPGAIASGVVALLGNTIWSLYDWLSQAEAYQFPTMQAFLGGIGSYLSAQATAILVAGLIYAAPALWIGTGVLMLFASGAAMVMAAAIFVTAGFMAIIGLIIGWVAGMSWALGFLPGYVGWPLWVVLVALPTLLVFAHLPKSVNRLLI